MGREYVGGMEREYVGGTAREYVGALKVNPVFVAVNHIFLVNAGTSLQTLRFVETKHIGRT